MVGTDRRAVRLQNEAARPAVAPDRDIFGKALEIFQQTINVRREATRRGEQN